MLAQLGFWELLLDQGQEAGTYAIRYQWKGMKILDQDGGTWTVIYKDTSGKDGIKMGMRVRPSLRSFIHKSEEKSNKNEIKEYPRIKRYV